MPMNIRNNNAANMVLGEWRKNDSKLAKDLKKASSGMKLNGAGDDAASYAISEKMAQSFFLWDEPSHAHQ